MAGLWLKRGVLQRFQAARPHSSTTPTTPTTPATTTTTTTTNTVRSELEQDLNSVAQSVEYQGLWGAVKTFPKRRPFVTNMLLCTTVAPFADYQMQRKEGKRSWESWDRPRTLCFLAFGIYQGFAVWFVYIRLFSWLFPRSIVFSNLSWAEKWKDAAGARQLVASILFDLSVYVPLWYFPAFYAFQGCIQIGPDETPWWQRYKSHFVEDQAVNWLFWLPGDILIFVVPAWLRLPTNAALTLFWSSIVSCLRGAGDGASRIISLAEAAPALSVVA
ncbi:unnamed protein product [Polarella glacialis]|uniref:Uncharacterized protein n=1 Tax=Polarella glacialis TaxID=89957 RepID=A0A813JRL5_POLGL|nr:unnamed protein product [Polarella glacialis]